MPTTTDAVKRAASPQEALLAIAFALDGLIAQVNKIVAAPLDLAANWTEPWSSGTDDPGETAQPDHSSAIEGAQRELEFLQNKLTETADPDERTALEARIRLTQDKLRPPPHNIDLTGNRTTIGGDETAAEVVLPPISAMKMTQRLNFATEMFKEATPGGLDQETAIAAYIKGGPQWLYYGNRDFVIGLPDHWKSIMVLDVAEESPEEAHEISRDLLKDPGSGVESAMSRWHGELTDGGPVPTA